MKQRAGLAEDRDQCFDVLGGLGEEGEELELAAAADQIGEGAFLGEGDIQPELLDADNVARVVILELLLVQR